MIQFLADENISTQIVAWLRGRGDDAPFAAEEAPGEVDAEWLRQAEGEGRLLLTSDKDFGELVFSRPAELTRGGAAPFK